MLVSKYHPIVSFYTAWQKKTEVEEYSVEAQNKEVNKARLLKHRLTQRPIIVITGITQKCLVVKRYQLLYHRHLDENDPNSSFLLITSSKLYILSSFLLKE